MIFQTDRRSILTGLGAFGLIGCAPKAETAPEAPERPAPAPEPFDLSKLEA